MIPAMMLHMFSGKRGFKPHNGDKRDQGSKPSFVGIDPALIQQLSSPSSGAPLRGAILEVGDNEFEPTVQLSARLEDNEPTSELRQVLASLPEDQCRWVLYRWQNNKEGEEVKAPVLLLLQHTPEQAASKQALRFNTFHPELLKRINASKGQTKLVVVQPNSNGCVEERLQSITALVSEESA
ncbi:hypothetical protein QOT17_007094 [Balamuthia mandrillaris]